MAVTVELQEDSTTQEAGLNLDAANSGRANQRGQRRQMGTTKNLGGAR